jgi:hypothetical protein
MPEILEFRKEKKNHLTKQMNRTIGIYIFMFFFSNLPTYLLPGSTQKNWKRWQLTKTYPIDRICIYGNFR